MKKTVDITLQGVRFHLEEDAYEKLRAYLNTIKEHFASMSEAEEIVSDIEARLAERFSDMVKMNREVVTLGDVMAAIDAMGTPERLDSESGEEASAKGMADHTATKQLYRSSDDVVIAGVAAGIATYLGVSPLVVRVAFILIALSGAFELSIFSFSFSLGIFIYVMFWLLLPQARTSAQKLEMRGYPVTLESLSRRVHGGLGSVKKHQGTFERLLMMPFDLLGRLLRFLSARGLPFFSKLVGLGLIVSAGFGALIGTIILAVIAASHDAHYVNFLLDDAISTSLLYTLLVSFYLMGLIPLILSVLVGARLLKERWLTRLTLPLSLIGVWALAVVVFSVGAVTAAGTYQEYLNTSPDFATTTKTEDVPALTAIKASSGYNLVITSGDEPVVTIEGRRVDVSRANLTVDDGILTIKDVDTDPNEKICVVFCAGEHNITVYVTTPDLKQLTLGDEDSATFDHVQIADLNIVAGRGSRLKGELAADNLTLQGNYSADITLAGTANSAIITLANYSYFHGTNFLMNNVTVTADRYARSYINVTGALTIITPAAGEEEFPDSAADSPEEIVHIIGSPTTIDRQVLTGEIDFDQDL
jgi:phage shock protein PspC (stress-responsive transcriptional regulator)